MRHSCSVGGTHWENLGGAGGLPGAKPTLFFAPAQIQKRAVDWGPGGVQQKLAVAWSAFQPKLAGWLHVIHGRGPAAIEATYRDVLEGRTAASDGHMLSF